MNIFTQRARLSNGTSACHAYLLGTITSGRFAAPGIGRVIGASFTLSGVRFSLGNEVIKKSDITLDPNGSITFYDKLSVKEVCLLIECFRQFEGFTREIVDLDTFSV